MEKNELTDVIDAVIGSLARAGNLHLPPIPDQVFPTGSAPHLTGYNSESIAQLPNGGTPEVEELIRGLIPTATVPTSGDLEPSVPSPRSQQSSDVVGQIARSMIPGVGLVSLFGGLFNDSNDGKKLNPLTPAYVPAQISADLTYDANTSNYTNTAYDLNGIPRNISSERPVQVTVNVSAMDSQSFLDHSSDIAHAVREAVLNSHALNDVLSEL